MTQTKKSGLRLILTGTTIFVALLFVIQVSPVLFPDPLPDPHTTIEVNPRRITRALLALLDIFILATFWVIGLSRLFRKNTEDTGANAVNKDL